MAVMLVLSPFTLFSFADGEELQFNDSGSPEVSMMAMRAIAAEDGISLAAAEGNSGQFGYNNIESFVLPPFYQGSYDGGRQLLTSDFVLQPGSYYFSFDLNRSFYSGSFFPSSGDLSLAIYGDISGNSCVFSFTLTEPLEGFLVFNYPVEGDELSIIDSSSSILVPVEGISSGYTYSSGIISKTTRSIFETLTPSFGYQPGGKYLVNIYHWGDSYDVKFHISDSTESYYLPTSTNGGVTTLVYNHPGGDFALEGSFTASNVETSVIEGDVDFNGSSSYGDLTADGPLSWVFNITDIVAIPYEKASDSNFGFFAPIIGFFRDQFSDMKSWIATQIDKIAGDAETKTDVDDAQSELQKEVEDLNNLSGQLDTQASNLEQQFTTDFAIPDTVSGQGTNFQSIYISLFGSLGVFGIFIWLPIVMAVIKKLLRL